MNQTLIGFIRKELIQSFRDPRMKFILLVAPIIQLFLFGVAISNEVKNIRLTAYFSNHDNIMFDIYQHSISTEWFVPVDHGNQNDPFEFFRSGKADVVMVAPPGGLKTHWT